MTTRALRCRCGGVTVRTVDPAADISGLNVRCSACDGLAEPEMPPVRLDVIVPHGLALALDKARGGLTRSAFIRQLIQERCK